MSWYFEDKTKVRLLREEAVSWWGTPFALFSRAKGPNGGIDCLGFVEEVTAAAGLERFSFDRTAEDYSRHVHNDKILNHLRDLEENAASAELKARWMELTVDEQEPMPGDLLIMKDAGLRGHGVFHMPIMVRDKIFMHCAPRLGVIEGQIDDPTYADHLVARFRARATPL